MATRSIRTLLSCSGAACVMAIGFGAAAQDAPGMAVPGGETQAGSSTAGSPQAGADTETVASEDGAALDVRIQTLIDTLDSDDFAQRERATEMLLAEPGFNRASLLGLLRTTEVSHEQRARLERVALTLFEREPRAGLGVQFGAQQGFGAPIARTVEGFDAHEVLEPGDVVLEVDGRRIRNASDLRYSIISRAPGEALPMKVLRVGEEIEVAPVLGSYADLGSAQQIDRRDLLVAWRLWFARIDAEAPSEERVPIIADTASSWTGDAPPPRQLVSGGSVRDGGNYAGVQRRTNIALDGNVRVFVDGQLVEPAAPANGPEGALDRFERSLADARIELDIAQQTLELDEILEAGNREQLEARIVDLKRRIEALEQAVESRRRPRTVEP